MSDIVIKAEHISKQYRLGEVGTGSLAHDLNIWWHSIRGKENPSLKIGEINDRTVRGNSEYVWALQNINFDVKCGEVLGIIGRNGAGKSTLLKILSRTTAPTTGRILIKGRVASLLEVGTGFHPDLTGRDNIFLNGAILGMSKKEIKSKFDEIVDFAGVERYIDTPVKRYSSGMYVRLAFAVAAHLEPEILIVDEVLAVGDVEFQKKCIGKMKDVSVKDGRTVLFVSHNIQAILSLCDRGILLSQGNLSFNGNAKECVSFYLDQKLKRSVKLDSLNDRSGDGKIRISDILFFNEENSPVEKLIMGRYCKILFQLDIKDDSVIDKDGFEIAIAFKNSLDQQIIHLSNYVSGNLFNVVKDGAISCIIPRLTLISGRYSMNVFMRFKGVITDWIMDIGPIDIEPDDYYGTGKLEVNQGLVLIDYKWDVQDLQN